MSFQATQKREIEKTVTRMKSIPTATIAKSKEVILRRR
jgi:hypothetical protein